MKINFYDRDARKITDPQGYKNYKGSLAIVGDLFNKGLERIGHYSNEFEADYVGVNDPLDMGFTFQDRKTFILHVWDQINTLPLEVVQWQKRTNIKIVSQSYRMQELWARFGLETKVASPGCDLEFFYQSVPKNNKEFTFVFDSFANVRSGLDLALRAFDVAFRGNSSAKFIIKNTSKSKKLNEAINHFIEIGNNIEFINFPISFESMRDLYSQSHVSLNIYRAAAWGLGIHQSAACGCLPLLGDFSPSNSMLVGHKVAPRKEVLISDYSENLINNWGLESAYGNFHYAEPPKFYDYDINEIAERLKHLKNNYSSYQEEIEGYREVISDNYSLEKSAKNLVEALR